jgi:hypothetical protein
MSRWISDLVGTGLTKFQLGIGGPFLKAVSSKIRARNAADSADIELVGSKVSAANGIVGLNEAATNSGASWTFDLKTPTTGQTEARVLTMPAGNPTVGQALTVTAYAAGEITLGFATVAGGNDKPVEDTTTLSFGSVSPVAMFANPANSVIDVIRVVIDTPFSGGTPSASVGIAGTTSKYMASTQLDLTAPAGTSYEVYPNLAASGSGENLIITYAAGGCTAGSARFLVSYVQPS